MLEMVPVAPSPQLQSVIERFFLTKASLPEGQAFRHTALPSIMQSIVFNFTDAHATLYADNGLPYAMAGDLVLGQHTRRFETELQGALSFIGVHFTPTGLYRLLQRPMQSFADTIRELKPLVDWYQPLRATLDRAHSDEARIAAIETCLADQVIPMDGKLEAVDAAASLIRSSNGAKSLADVGKATGLSERSMQRFFLEIIGVSPKAFARIARFNGVTRLMEAEDVLNWQTILLEAGYFDAAHFAHDFKEITGQTPGTYYKGKTAYERFFYGT